MCVRVCTCTPSAVWAALCVGAKRIQRPLLRRTHCPAQAAMQQRQGVSSSWIRTRSQPDNSNCWARIGVGVKDLVISMVFYLKKNDASHGVELCCFGNLL